MKITLQEAFKKYLDSGYENIMPFDSNYGENFLKLLKRNGYEIIGGD